MNVKVFKKNSEVVHLFAFRKQLRYTVNNYLCFSSKRNFQQALRPRSRNTAVMFNILLTCEHGGNDVPSEYQHLFENAQHVLETHRGWDIGILPFAEDMGRELQAPLISSTVSRLLVELNRSLGHPQLFSEFSEKLPKNARQELLQKYYFPHREMVAQAVEESLKYGRVFHITVHSFTPELHGQVRNADITFLYDYRRKSERELSEIWQSELESVLPVRVRRNYPYRGHTDGLTTALRKKWSEDQYVGICIDCLLYTSPSPRD